MSVISYLLRVIISYDYFFVQQVALIVKNLQSWIRCNEKREGKLFQLLPQVGKSLVMVL
jgi:hypothetical protein